VVRCVKGIGPGAWSIGLSNEYRTAEQGTAESSRGHFDIPYSLFDILRFKRDTRQNSEVRDQMSEVRGKLISDLRLLTSVMEVFNDLSN